VNDIAIALKSNEACIEMVRFKKYGMVRHSRNKNLFVPGSTDSVCYSVLIKTRDKIDVVLFNNGSDLEDDFIHRYSELIEKQKLGLTLKEPDIADSKNFTLSFGSRFRKSWGVFKPFTYHLTGSIPV